MRNRPRRKINPAISDQPQAAALRYDAQADGAPRLVARGTGRIAEKMLELAGEHDIPVSRDVTLVSILSALDVGAEIPADLYDVIAEVLAWAYRADKREEKTAQRSAA